MAGSDKRIVLSYAAILLVILCYTVSVVRHSADLPRPWQEPEAAAENSPPPLELSPDVAKIVQALHSRGNYSAMIPDLVSKFQSADDEDCPGDTAVTVFVPADDSEYHVCVSQRPEVQIVLARLDRGSFGSGGISNGSVLETCGGGEIRVIESAAALKGYLHAEVVDWNLYDDVVGGRVIVHGIGGELSFHRLVAAVGKFAISGLVNPRRNDSGDGLGSLCRSPRRARLPAPRTHDSYREAFVRRVDGLPVPLTGM